MEDGKTEASNKKCNYLIRDYLFSTIRDIGYFEKIYLSVYLINTSGEIPFLQYLFMNNGFNVLDFPRIYMNTEADTESGIETENGEIKHKYDDSQLIKYAKTYLSRMLGIYDIQDFNDNVIFEGFFNYNDNLYLFLNISYCKFDIDETYLSSTRRLGLIDEIVNNKNVCGIPIDHPVVEMFLHNNMMIYIVDENNRPYEIPIAAFVGKPTEKKLEFTKTFGESPKNNPAPFGPYYYFTSFHYAIRQGGWSENYEPETEFGNLITDDYGKYLRGGIVRFALFVGKTKIVENMPRDPDDKSLIKKTRLIDPKLNKQKEFLTMRITDYDGNWTKKYESVYLAKIELDDGTYPDNVPMLVVKDYKQQIPLSYHLIDTTRLGTLYYDDNMSYSIL
jgi:hypothetical protein